MFGLRLKGVYLYGDQFSGSVELLLLNLLWNGLIGSVPKSLGGFKAANVIDLSHNWLNGSIPDEIGGAAMLEELRLDGNFFIGSIAAQIQNCSVLMTL
ncbi:probable LRR receptor-like serine/threonine-protein kinase IRK [Tanacetum coccineum]